VAATAVAVLAFAADCDDIVVRLETAQRQRQPLPASKHRRQPAGSSGLQHVDDDNDHYQNDDRQKHGQQDVPAGERQPEHCQRHDEVEYDEVGHGKPAVVGRRVTEELGEPDGYSA